MKLSVSAHPYRRVRISAAQLANLKDNDAVTMLVEVSATGYVPEHVRVRARISEHLFTGITEARNLPLLEQDQGIKAVMVGR